MPLLHKLCFFYSLLPRNGTYPFFKLFTSLYFLCNSGYCTLFPLGSWEKLSCNRRNTCIGHGLVGLKRSSAPTGFVPPQVTQCLWALTFSSLEWGWSDSYPKLLWKLDKVMHIIRHIWNASCPTSATPSTYLPCGYHHFLPYRTELSGWYAFMLLSSFTFWKMEFPETQIHSVLLDALG